MKRRALTTYIVGLVLILGAILATSALRGGGFASGMLPWFALITLFGIVEYADLSFHDDEARFGLSFSEALFVPLVVGFSFSQTVWGVVLAIAVVETVRRGKELQKWLFNVASFGCSAAGAAGVWLVVGDGSGTLSLRNGGAALLAGVAFAVLTHLLTSVVLMFATGRSMQELTRDVAPATQLGWIVSPSLGLFFAGAYLAAPWMLVLFPFPLVGLFLGYRAVLSQRGERERIEKLHEATRALAASPDLDHAVVGFLAAVEDIVSAGEARAVIAGRDGHRWSAVRGGEAIAVMEPAEGTPLIELMIELQRAGGTLVVSEDADGPQRRVADSLGARSLVAVGLDDEGGGCLVAMDRVGADEFGQAETHMLHALAQELVLSLDSHRLFSQVVEERERFRRIFAGSREGICLLDGNGKVVAWNPALEGITGYSTQEIVGSVLADSLVIRTADERRLTHEDLIAARPDQVLEVVTREGPTRWIALLSGHVMAADGGHVILVRDVTREHTLEEAKSDFLSTISHELRTPLTAIKGSLQIMARSDEEVSRSVREQMVAVMQRGSDRLERLVLNLLFVSQIELDGAPNILAEELDLEQIVRERLQPLVPEHIPVDVVTLKTEPILVRADRERFGQVVEHLLDNAVKFGDGAPIRVEITRSNGFAELAVIDDGPGVPEGDRERIFERFVRLGHSLRRETQGAGVGLFIVRESVQAMGGRVWVEGDPGEGAAFRVTIPLARPMAVPATG